VKASHPTEERNCWLCQHLDTKRPSRVLTPVRWWCRRRCEYVNDPATSIVCNRFEKKEDKP